MKKPLFLMLTTLCLSGSFQNSFAQAGSSLNFDGADDQVNLGSGINAALDPLNTITVEAWVQPSSLSGFDVIVGNYNTSSVNGEMQFLLRKDNDQYSFFVDDNSGYTAVSTGTGTVTINSWQHVAGVWDGSEIRIYLDGILMNTVTGVTGTDFSTTSNFVSLGNNAMGENLIGSLDEVRVWSTARTATLIQDNMNCSVTPDSPGLLALYNFNNGAAAGINTSNTTLYDVSGNAYNGTLSNFGLTGATSNYTADHYADYLSLRASIGSTGMADRLSYGVSIDYDNDGDNDVLVTDESTQVRLYLNDGMGNFSAFTVVHSTGNGFVPVAGDLDNDGDDDYLLSAVGVLTAYINDGAGNYTPLPANLISGTGYPSVAKIADLNNDGKNDIVFGNGYTSATDLTEVWLNTGTTGNASFIFSAGLTNSGGGKNSIAIGDIDEDGDMDLILGSSSWGALLYLNNSNDGTFTAGTAPGGYSGGAMLHDWNQDGHLDYMNYDNYNNYGLRVALGDGSGTFGTSTQLLANYASNHCRMADLNGDGFLDAVLSNWGGYALVYISNGCNYSLQSSCNYALGRADNYITLSDFNNDGSIDIFCQARDNKSTFYLNYLSPVTNPALSNITSVTGTTICEGNTATISAVASNAGTIDWYTGAAGGSSLATGNTFTTGTLSSGIVYYAGASNSNGCASQREAVTVTVNLNPTATQNSSSVTSLLCNGDMNGSAEVDVTLNGTATSATYLWDDAGATTTEDLTGMGAGTYTLTVTDNNTCTAAVSITITEPSAIAASAAGSMVDCNGDADGTINLTASGGTGTLSFLWDDAGSSATEDLSGLSAGTYTVTITDANNCTATSSATVTEPAALTGSGTSTDEINGNDGSIDLTISGGTSPYIYSWTGPGSFASTSEDLLGLAAGTYSVTATDANGCSFTTNVTVGSQVGINELQNKRVAVYPNPTNGILTIETSGSGINKIEITDATGRIVLGIENSGNKSIVDLSKFGKGIYFIHIVNGGIRTVEKVIVQ